MSGSELLVEVAQERGLRVRRLGPELVECADAHRRVLFFGLAGSRSGRPAQVLCADTGWLRAHLTRTGLPVPAYAADHELAATLPVDHELAAALPADHELRSMIGAERGAGGHDQQGRVGGTSLEVAVVAGTVVAARRPAGDTTRAGPGAGHDDATVEVPVGEIPAAGALAVRAVAALPDTAYASVRLIEDPSAVVVDTVDPTLAGWGAPADAAARRVIAAILDLEFA